jgi:hypothetical protein
MDSIFINDIRQDLQDYLDIKDLQFPEETANMQSASRKS